MPTPAASRTSMIPAADAARLAREGGIEIPELMTNILPRAAELARPPISNFRVGVVSRGLSGNLYFGTNVEFAGEALSFTVHAEQSSVANAWMHGEEGIDLLAVTAAPCGYCRQFLNELVTAPRLVVRMPAGTRPLQELLPEAFGPRDLGIDGGLMQREQHAVETGDGVAGDELARKALQSARMSYAPYSKAYAGIALRTAGGAIVTGAYAENAAFNPSMSPLEVALSQLNLQGVAFEEIADAVLVQVGGLHTSATAAVLAAVCDAPLRVVQARVQARNSA
jgi:cytidine deaminase